MAHVDPRPLIPLLQPLWDQGISDLLLVAGAAPLVRVDGSLVPLPGEGALTGEAVEHIVRQVLPPELWASFERTKELDFSFGWEGIARFRGNVYRQRDTVAMALRLIPFRIPSFDDLGLPRAVANLATLPQGLVLVTGPTGSGKSTTLAAMVDHINVHRRCHILTIEDPIEYVHQHRNSAVSQREIGTDSDTFERALRSALREDPDVLMLGEMRDPETMQVALTIAETGHLVFATLHTNDASSAVDRIVDVFPADRQTQIRVQLSGTLSAVVAQRLLPRVDGGRVAAFEVLLGNGAVRNLVREGKSRQLRNVIATCQREGMQTLEMSLSDLVERRLVTYDDAVAVSLWPAEVGRPPDGGAVSAPPTPRATRGGVPDRWEG